MTSTTQRISITTILAATATISGILVDVPQLIRDNIGNVPSFLKNPNVIWTMSVFVVYGTCILFLLLRHRKTGSWSLTAVNRIGAVLLNVADFCRKHDVEWDLISLGTQHRTADEAEAILRYCTKELPNAIQTTLGDKERDAYLKHTEWLPMVSSPPHDPNVYAIGIWNWLTEYVKRETMEALRRDAAAIRSP